MIGGRKETMKPLLCNTRFVNNILAGLQTQDRRPIKPQPEYQDGHFYWWKGDWDTRGGPRAGVCTHGKPGNGEATWTLKEIAEHARYKVGDVLYVRETWRIIGRSNHNSFRLEIQYKADMSRQWYNVAEETYLKYPFNVTTPAYYRWRPNIHMPKWAARIFLKVTGVGVERVRDATVEDIRAEGVTFDLIRDMLKPTKTKQGHWISGNEADQSEDYCYDCAEEIVKETNKKFHNTDCIVDGGWENHDSDYIARCEKCDCLLNFWPTEHLIETEIEGFEQSDCAPGMFNTDRYILDVMCNAIDACPELLGDRLMKLCWQYLWNSIYPGSWERNDYVFVYEFEKLQEKP